jgi:hypothetical protein
MADADRITEGTHSRARKMAPAFPVLIAAVAAQAFAGRGTDNPAKTTPLTQPRLAVQQDRVRERPRPQHRNLLLAALVLCAVLLALSAEAARAGTVLKAFDVVDYTADAGQEDVLSVTREGGSVVFNRLGGSLDVGFGCNALSASAVGCPDPSTSMRVELGDRDDFLAVDDPVGLPTMVSGETGKDEIFGADRVDQLQGGDGDDELAGRGGNDLLFGESGSDRLSGGAGEDTLGNQSGADDVHGGAGNDRMFGGFADELPTSVSLDNLANDGSAGEGDNIHDDVEILLGNAKANVFTGHPTIPSDNRFEGQPGDDTLSGMGGDDTLLGGPGADVLSGGSSTDTLHGGTGDDHLDARDGVAEVVDCGEGSDGAVVDATDTTRSCEAVDASTPPDPGPANPPEPGPAPPTKPGPIPADRGPATSPEPANNFRFAKLTLNRHKGTATLVVELPGPGALVLAGKKLKRVRRNASAAVRVRLPLRARRKPARELRRRGRLNATATVTYTPTGGQPRTKSRRIVLKRRRSDRRTP